MDRTLLPPRPNAACNRRCGPHQLALLASPVSLTPRVLVAPPKPPPVPSPALLSALTAEQVLSGAPTWLAPQRGSHPKGSFATPLLIANSLALALLGGEIMPGLPNLASPALSACEESSIKGDAE